MIWLQLDLSGIIENIKKTVDTHRLAEGKYARYLYTTGPDGTVVRDAHVNEYGCADAANILYTIGKLEQEPDKRREWVETIREMQNPETGLFEEATHSPFHTTAHCIAALELFDARPVHPLTALKPYQSREGLFALLDGLNWSQEPWPQSHIGAGIYASFVITDCVPQEWYRWYFGWLWQETDEETGMWRKGYVHLGNDGSNAPLYHYMAASFHYLFNHEFAKMPLRYPDKMIDSCLALYHDPVFQKRLGKEVNFLDIDWIYCLTRAGRQSAHRFEERRQVLERYAQDYIAFLNGIDYAADPVWNDLHMLFGCVCALAELQAALPGMILTEHPLRLVLERRPFI